MTSLSLGAFSSRESVGCEQRSRPLSGSRPQASCNGGEAHCNNVQLGRFGRNRTNVWNYPGANVFKRKAHKSDLELHPTVKPIAMVTDAILDSTNLDDVILDPFLGSGTTLLAAERARRRCHGVELDPLYIDTVIARWEGLTQQQARLASGQTFADIKSERSGN